MSELEKGKLRLPNFAHLTTSIIEFDSSDKILLMTSWAEEDLYFKEASSSYIFSDIIKIVTKFIQKIFNKHGYKFKDSKKLKDVEILYQNAVYICIF